MIDRMQARDPAYDGRFITGVLTTGIYCLPSCKARNPKPENVRFFPEPEEARQAGLRACKRCRPDDFYRRADPDRATVIKRVDALRRAPAAYASVEAWVEASGWGASKLHQLVRFHFHSTPACLLRKARVAAAQDLLLGSQHSVAEIAFEVGYESLSSFGEAFRREAGMAPGEYRQLPGASSFSLRLPDMYPAEAILRYLGRDPESLTDRVRGRCHESGFWMQGKPARLSLEIREDEVSCRLAGEGFARGAAVRAHGYALRRLGFGWLAGGFERHVGQRPELAALVAGRKGLRAPLTGTPFDALVWAILGQQINLPFAFRLQRRLVELAGSPAGDGLWAPPQAAAVAGVDPDRLLRRQFSRRKAEYLIGVAQEVAQGRLDLAALGQGSAEVLEERLLALRGIGPWTAHYVMMRGFGFEDCVPVGDAGLVKGLQTFFSLAQRPDAAKTQELMEVFRPYRSLATFHFWKSLEVAG